MQADDTYRPPAGQYRPRLRLLGRCAGCNVATPQIGAFAIPMPHFPAGLAGWICRPCGLGGLRSPDAAQRMLAALMVLEVDKLAPIVTATGRPVLRGGR